MTDDHKKTYKGTGTVPKAKPRNVSETSQNNVLSNNLGREEPVECVRRFRNRNFPYVSHLAMDCPEQTYVRENGVSISNGTSTPNTSRTNSRRNSTGTVPKCDNVAKYPDRKQIEAKLGQIREYLRVTTSLMNNMRNTDEQLQNSILIQSNDDESVDREQLEKMIKDLRDSEEKLVALLSQIETDDEEVEQNIENGVESIEPPVNRRDLEKKVEQATNEMIMLREQENLLLTLQQNAESQLREARLAQDRLRKGTPIRNTNLEPDGLLNGYAEPTMENKNSNGNKTDIIKDLEEKLNVLLVDGSRAEKTPVPEPYQNEIEVLRSRINRMREGNDHTNQLIQILDTRDSQLQAEHLALQDRLAELQNKKYQVDQLVLQLQNLNDDSEDEMTTSQVKRIKNMKEKLAQLKSMVLVAQETEDSIESHNAANGVDNEENVRRLCSKTDNLIQNDTRSNRSPRRENNSTPSSNERRLKDKQVNKKSMNANERERLKLQAELQAKKRELEELMCKHKATSNLNHDTNNEVKGDLACPNLLLDGASNSWFPIPNYALPQSSDSDDCREDDMNEYSEINSARELNVQPMPAMSYPTSNYTKHHDEEPRVEMPPDGFSHGLPRTPDRRSVRSSSIAAPVFANERQHRRSSTTNERSEKNQLQKQIELIRSVCNSMLDQPANSSASTNIQVRNNLTPSPVYSEPRQFTSPNANALNTLTSVTEQMNTSQVPNCPLPEAANYHSWLTTNTLQTQAFMLNTLNQCCQMLWLQQRELTSLRNTVSMMQERYQHQNTPYQDTNPLYMNPNTYLYPSPTAGPNLPHTSNNHSNNTNNQLQQQQSQCRQTPSKANAPVTGASSMPNLNHLQPHVNNMESPAHSPACPAHCNALNNTSLLHSVNQHHHHHHGQLWHGQALNNQVAPGNRANNYWDNFRSYSRQNLLSTKSNEGLQNNSAATSERSQAAAPPVPPPAASQTTLKLNTDAAENTTLVSTDRPAPRKLSSAQRSSSSIPSIPPDVLNVNQIHKNNEPFFDFDNHFGDGAAGYHQQSNNSFGGGDGFMESQPSSFKEASAVRNRNEWHDDNPADNNSKSKLFEELRENVYKEVASLISANHGRPHFLIQLFKDLQLISSDPLRRRALQSIQSVITNSLSTPASSASTSRQAENGSIYEDNAPSSGDWMEVHPFMWPQLPKPSRSETDNIEPGTQEQLSEVLTFLLVHKEDIFSDSLVHTLRDLLVESTFSAVFTTANTKDGIIQKHFVCLLTEALEQFRGKKVQDVRINVLQTIEELLRGEISLIRLMRENIADNDMNVMDAGNMPAPLFDMDVPIILEDANMPPIQNGDLAEADQSRIELDEDEEGAVGGVLNIILERTSTGNSGQVVSEENDLPKLDLVLSAEPEVEYAEQGLDEVPTRLTSRSNSPHKDKKNSRIEGPEHF